MSLDPAKNLPPLTLAAGIDSVAVSLTLVTGDGAKLDDPASAGAYNATIYNYSDYIDPNDDPNVERIRITAKNGDALTIQRPVVGNSYNGEGSDNTAKNHNTAGKTYKIIIGPTKKFRDDIQTELGLKAAKGANSDITSLSGLTTALSIAQGGTGAATLTANALLLGNGIGAIAPLALGTANQIPGMNAGGTAYEHKTISGTTNQVVVTHSAGAITFSLPQNIHTGATPTFAGLGIGITPTTELDINGRLRISNYMCGESTGGKLTFYGDLESANPFYFYDTGNFKIGGSAVRATTEATKALYIFDGTAPVGTLANGISLYSTAGELRVMDSAGNATLLSPHDKNNNWIMDTYVGQGKKRRRLIVDMEKLVKKINDKFGWDFVHEFVIK